MEPVALATAVGRHRVTAADLAMTRRAGRAAALTTTVAVTTTTLTTTTPKVGATIHKSGV
jgi:hypothetical protein